MTPPRRAGGLSPAATWTGVAADIRAWAAAQRVPVRDLIVLLPFVQLVPPARRALASGDGWQPRVETTRTLAESLGPAVAGAEGPSFDPTLDRLAVSALLRGLPRVVAWEKRDRRAFNLAVQATVDAAQVLARAAQALPPAARPAHWDCVSDAVGPRAGPAALEGSLLRLAVEWARGASAPASDRLFALKPAGWVVVRAGGPDALADNVSAHDPSIPRLVIDLDATADRTEAAPSVFLCDDLEHEAQAAAAGVLAALNRGEAPVALVALDRVLVRRVSAMLARAGVRLADETGWKLSTTRAAARLMSWLRASSPTASADDRLDWLKGWPPAAGQAQALHRLEAHWRRAARTVPAGPAESLWLAAQAALAWAGERREMPLSDWLARWQSALAASGEWDPLAADAAGAQALQALRLASAPVAGERWRTLAQSHRLDLTGFTAWVDEALEGASFVLPAEDADVVLTPLARTPLRPFGAVVMPGADARHLGQAESGRGLISDALAAELGLPTAAERRRRERLAFAHLLDQPRLTLTRRRLDGDEPLTASPDLLALNLARRAAGRTPLVERPWQGPTTARNVQPVARPLPSAPDALPAVLSASQVEALRACPYRFFARVLLRLQEDEEIDRGVEKRDYGTWLHAVLHRFHAGRDAAQSDDAVQLAAAARTEVEAGPFDAADMLPFLASFEAFVPAYLGWLAAQEAQGWRWQRGEVALRIAPRALAPTELHGRIDRIDADGGRRLLIDYKTGSAASLKSRMKPLSEDTQLAFYAALLLGHESPAGLEAAYLTLDDADAPSLLPHADVRDSAEALVTGLGNDLRRLRAGAALPALGEGATCEHCEMRGLCRRDHWADPAPADGALP